MQIDKKLRSYQLILWLLYNLCTIVGYSIDVHDWNLALMVSTLLILPISLFRYEVEGVPEALRKSIWVTLTTVTLLLFGVGVYLEPLHDQSAFAIKLGAFFYILAVAVPHWHAFEEDSKTEKSQSNKKIYFTMFVNLTFFLVLASIAIVLAIGDVHPWVVALLAVYVIAFLCTGLYYSRMRHNAAFGTFSAVLYVASILLYGAYLGYDTERPDTPENVENFGFAGAAVLCLSILGTHVWGDLFRMEDPEMKEGPIRPEDRTAGFDALNVRSLVF